MAQWAGEAGGGGAGAAAPQRTAALGSDAPGGRGDAPQAGRACLCKRPEGLAARPRQVLSSAMARSSPLGSEACPNAGLRGSRAAAQRPRGRPNQRAIATAPRAPAAADRGLAHTRPAHWAHARRPRGGRRRRIGPGSRRCSRARARPRRLRSLRPSLRASPLYRSASASTADANATTRSKAALPINMATSVTPVAAGAPCRLRADPRPRPG